MLLHVFTCFMICIHIGETTFDDIEDLVADGLIALYMEENNVDEYLKSARESTEVRRTSVLPNIIEPVQEKERSEPLPPPLPPRLLIVVINDSYDSNY